MTLSHDYWQETHIVCCMGLSGTTWVSSQNGSQLLQMNDLINSNGGAVMAFMVQTQLLNTMRSVTPCPWEVKHSIQPILSKGEMKTHLLTKDCKVIHGHLLLHNSYFIQKHLVTWVMDKFKCRFKGTVWADWPSLFSGVNYTMIFT